MSVRNRAPDGQSIDDETAEHARDAMIVKFRRRCLSWRAIGKMMGCSHEYARKRYNAIPDADRRRFESQNIE